MSQYLPHDLLRPAGVHNEVNDPGDDSQHVGQNLKYQDKDSEVYKEYIFGDDKDIKMILVDERHLRKQKHGDFRDTDLYQMRFGVQIPTGP